MYLDTNVWLVLLITILLCLALTSYKLISENSCIPFAISAQNLTHEDSVFKTNETIIFKTSLPEVKEISWDFGDNTNNESSAATNKLHKFTTAGEFTVQAIVNGRCS